MSNKERTTGVDSQYTSMLALEVLQQRRQGQGESVNEEVRERFLSLAKARIAHTETIVKNDKRDPGDLSIQCCEEYHSWGGSDFLPYAVLLSQSGLVHNETVVTVTALVNMNSVSEPFKHIARAVDPPAWVETGFFADVYPIGLNGQGVPLEDSQGVPIRDPRRTSSNGLPQNKHELVLEDFDLSSITGEPVAWFRNVLAIHKPEWREGNSTWCKDGPLQLDYRLYRSVSSALQGFPRAGGMNKNEGFVRAEIATPDRLAELLTNGTLKAWSSLEKVVGSEADLLERMKHVAKHVADRGGQPTADDKLSAGLVLRKLHDLMNSNKGILITVEKRVRFDDLTPQGEPFVDPGELLNYAAPFFLKPFLELLLLFGACSTRRPCAQGCDQHEL